MDINLRLTIWVWVKTCEGPILFHFFCALKGGPFSRRSQLTETGDLLYFQRRLPVPVVLVVGCADWLGMVSVEVNFLLFSPNSMEVLVCFSQKISTGGFSIANNMDNRIII